MDYPPRDRNAEQSAEARGGVSGEQDDFGPNPLESRSQAVPVTTHKRRTAVGVLLNYTSFFSEGIEGRLRRALDAECARRDWDLYLIYGRSLEEPDPSCSAYNAVFDLVHPARIDAVVVISNLLAGACGSQRLNEYVRRFRAFPRCSLGMVLTSLPSVEVDNRPGMEALVEHLVTVHGYRRFVFMAGLMNHSHSLARLETFQTVLARHGIPFDQDLLVAGNFLSHAAEAAMDKLQSRRRDFDVVVAANDAMAIGVIASLRKHGRKVPDDCAVTGFDDLIHARLGNPPITTVAQPLELLAQRALDSVEAQLAGREAPAVTLVAGDLCVRNSCGCSSSAPLGAAPCESREATAAVEHLRAVSGRLLSQIERTLGESRSSATGAHLEFLQALESELAGGGPALVAAARALMSSVPDDPEYIRAWYGVVELLEEEFRPYAVPCLEASWSGVRRELVHALAASNLQQQMAMDSTYVQLLGSEDSVFGALKVGALQDSLQRHLPTAGIGTVSLSQYVDGEPGMLEPLVYFVDGEGDVAQVGKFPDYLLLPPAKAFRARKTFVVMPLVMESRSLGMSVLEYSNGLIPYHLLRDQISAALGTYRLQREIEHQSALRERSVQERVATTQRLESLSILAGGVAHDLNNVLGPLVAFPDIMLSQLEAAAARDPAINDLREDIELIKMAGQRASQTIKDLLTLSRQGRTPKSPMDVNRVLRECGEECAARRPHGYSDRIRVSVDLACSPLVILASEAHVVRAITNLIQNAIDVIEAEGEVRLRSYPLRIDEPLDRYEAIASGDYVVVEVADSGKGLPSEIRQRIFEPFFSTKRLGQGSGTGLGLAIVHAVVKEHEGFIDFDSSPGMGTTFRLYFPSSQSPVASTRPPKGRRVGGERILVVDDEPIQLRTSRRVLTRYGYEVELTSSGVDALERIARAAAGQEPGYDLVILDVQLSDGEDGLDICERIRRIAPAQKAILASGHAPTHRIQEALEREIPWLQKPYTADALADIVRTVLDDGRPRPTEA